jgi:hypothetical protein
VALGPGDLLNWYKADHFEERDISIVHLAPVILDYDNGYAVEANGTFAGEVTIILGERSKLQKEIRAQVSRVHYKKDNRRIAVQTLEIGK